jgi:hypothetical protein
VPLSMVSIIVLLTLESNFDSAVYNLSSIFVYVIDILPYCAVKSVLAKNLTSPISGLAYTGISICGIYKSTSFISLELFIFKDIKLIKFGVFSGEKTG